MDLSSLAKNRITYFLTRLPIRLDVNANVSSDTPTFLDAQCLHLPDEASLWLPIFNNI